jgi:kynureninase
MKPDYDRLRSRFLILDERTYFDSQCYGPPPVEMLADLDELKRTLLLRKRAIPLWFERLSETAALIEALLNAPPGSVALRDSATAAHAAFAAAIAPRPGKARILFTSTDFHSIRYLWGAQVRRGFDVHEIVAGDGGQVSTEELVSAIDARAAVVAAALVSPRNGALLDAPAVVRAAHAHDALVVLDAYQAVGVVPIDVQALGVDVLVGGTHKWLGGGDSGLAFMYVRPALAEELEPAYPGWFGSDAQLAFQDAYVPTPGARRFQQGTPAVGPIYTARAGLRLTLEIGVDNIRARSLELTARMLDRALTRGLVVRTPRAAEARGGMLCIDAPNAEAIVEQLEGEGIDVDYRPGAGIRVGPHVCHRDDECDRVIDAIAGAVRT